MKPSDSNPIVHLELHTRDRSRARGLYAGLLGWRAEPVDTRGGCYLALGFGSGFGGGIVECDTGRATWLPYVEVDRVDEFTDRACQLGATVLLEPREGPAGWRSVVAGPAGGEMALWQPKR